MTTTTDQPPRVQRKGMECRFSARQTLRLGYVQLIDAAPLLLADWLGLYEKFGLPVTLERELGWATVREKLIHGEIDGAQALGPMPFAASLGLGLPQAVECLTPLVLNVNGNGLTLGTHLREEGVAAPSDLKEVVRCRPDSLPLTFGVVSYHSSHYILLRRWLAEMKLELGRDVRVVVIPPRQMVSLLDRGNLDGYLVGEPWSSAAVKAGKGWIAATSATIAPDHPEKLIMLRHDFAKNRPDEVIRLVAALLEACALCDDPEERGSLVRHLSSRKHLDCPEEWLRTGLGLLSEEEKEDAGLLPDTCRFFGPGVNQPSAGHGQWILEGMLDSDLLPGCEPSFSKLIESVFAPEYFEAARRLVGSNSLSK